MGPIKYILNILTGKISHWNNTNSKVVSDIWGKIGMLESPYDTIFKHFLVSAEFVLERLIGLESKSQKVGLHYDLKQIDIVKFRKLYSILIAYFIFLLNSTTSFIDEDLSEPLQSVVPDFDISKKVIISLNKIGKNERSDISITGGKIWDEVLNTVSFGNRLDPSQLLYFVSISGEAFKIALRGIESESDDI